VPFVSGQVWCLALHKFFADAYTRYSFQISNIFRCLQLNNLELAVNLAKRANLPGAENLVNSMTSMLLWMVFLHLQS
jgi:hypothetical protein